MMPIGFKCQIGITNSVLPVAASCWQVACLASVSRRDLVEATNCRQIAMIELCARRLDSIKANCFECY